MLLSAPETERLRRELDELIERRAFEIHFQPLVDVQAVRLLGYEALTRGPANSALHSPLVLFELAAQLDRLVTLERVLVRLIVKRFCELQLPGQLFINVTADTLSQVAEQREPVRQDFSEAALGLPPSRIVVELTETRPVLDLRAMQSSLEALREMGFRVALDDLGEGFAGLRRWSELRPDFVKIDRHFIDGVASDPVKLQFVRAMAEMAAGSGATVIAEGLEDEGDLRVIARLGIAVCQGYLLGRPHALPRATLRPDLPALLDRNRSPGEAGSELNAGQLARSGLTVTPLATCREVIAMFQRDPQMQSLPVLDEAGRPVGVLRSMAVFRRGSERYFDELFGRRSCSHLMDPNPLVFDSSATLRRMSEALASQDERLLGDGFIVTVEGRYLGSGRSSELLRAVSDLQVQTARHASPLTGLPGNISIDRYLDLLLRGSEAFVVAHWDLTHFKAYNDEYGFAAGDDMIRLAADALRASSDAQTDFLGHVGGDDFVQVLRGAGWADRLQKAAQRFDSQAQALFSAAHREAGGYAGLDRKGHAVFHPLPLLCAGALQVQPGDFPQARALAAAMTGVRKLAKRMTGASGYMLERRDLALKA